MRAPYAPTIFLLLVCLLVSRIAVCAAVSPSHLYNEVVDNGSQGYYPTYTYATEQSVIAPKTNWLQWDPRCDDGLYYFLTPRGYAIEHPGPMILDGNGDLIWTKHFANEYGGQAYDFRVQQYQGQVYLTFWTGDDRVRGHGAGSYLMLNASYDIAHSVNAANDLEADLHEFLITPDDTALLTIYHKVEHDVTNFRTFNETENKNDAEPNWIWESIFQEIGIEQNNLIFEWRASDHIDLNQTYHDIHGAGNHDDPFDWFHINSIQKDKLGNYLISARYTHSIYYIDGVSGDVLWTLGGKSNQFQDLSDGMAINFAWQHDARFIPSDSFPSFYTPPAEREAFSTTLLSMFDNAAEDQNYAYGMDLSRGLLLEISYPNMDDRNSPSLHDLLSRPSRRTPITDEHHTLDPLNAAKLAEINGTDRHYTARVIKSYENPARVRSSSQGSMQILPPNPRHSGLDEAKVFLGYGLNAIFTEFDASGPVLCDAHFGATTSWERGDIQSYRAYKFAWRGAPAHRPKIAISDDDVEVWISWNGATEVAEWVLQVSDVGEEGKKGVSWTDLTKQPRDGFETAFTIPERNVGEHRYLRALALDSSGHVLEHGVSLPLDRGLLASMLPEVGASVPEPVARSSWMRVMIYVLGVIVMGCAAFQACKRIMSWRTGGGGGGAVRWRKGSGFWSFADA